MKIGADPVAEDRATAIMWIVATLFAIPIMIGTAFGVSWVAGMTLGYIAAVVPSTIVVVGDILGVAAMGRHRRSARYPRTGLLIGIGALLLIILIAPLTDMAE